MKYTVLLVNENESRSDVLARWLKQGGFGMIPARSGAEAIALSLEKHPDLVLLDTELSDVNGYAVCRRLKADEQTRRIPVVLHDGLDGAVAPEAAKDVSADAFLTPPVQPTQLWAVLHECVARAAIAAKAAA